MLCCQVVVYGVRVLCSVSIMWLLRCVIFRRFIHRCIHGGTRVEANELRQRTWGQQTEFMFVSNRVLLRLLKEVCRFVVMSLCVSDISMLGLCNLFTRVFPLVHTWVRTWRWTDWGPWNEANALRPTTWIPTRVIRDSYRCPTGFRQDSDRIPTGFSVVLL